MSLSANRYIYLPEADLQWGSVYDTKHTSRLAIIVGGKYNGSQKETFYRVDLTNDQTSETMNILRNHCKSASGR